MKKILLVLIGVSVTLFADFSRSGAGVVTDSVTSLQWQDDYSDNSGAIKTANWKDAIEYCNGLSLDKGGWRLPNKNELLSIVDHTKFNPAIDINFQNTSTSGYYWSSTLYASHPSHAWGVYFGNGYSSYSISSNTRNVRCARSGQ